MRCILTCAASNRRSFCRRSRYRPRCPLRSRSFSIQSSTIGDGVTNSCRPRAGARTVRTGHDSHGASGAMSIAANLSRRRQEPVTTGIDPVSFFAAAASFNVLMWLVLLIGAGEAVGFRGGLGATLASVHLDPGRSAAGKQVSIRPASMQTSNKGLVETQLLRRTEPIAIEIGEQIVVLPIDFGAHLLDAQRAEVRQ